MAMGDLTNFRLYEAQFTGSFIEVGMQFADAFNAASRGSLILGSQGHRGQKRFESFYQDTLQVTHRTPGSQTAYTPDPITQSEIVGVKVNKSTYVAQEEDAFYKINQSPEELGRVAGRQQAVAVQIDRVNRACSSLVGAITAADTSFGVSDPLIASQQGTNATPTTMDHDALNEGIRLFGDRGNNLTFIVMHSKVWYDLVGSAVSGNQFETSAFAIREGATATMGRPVLVTDSAALSRTGGTAEPTTVYRTLILSAGALIIDQSEPLRILMERKTGSNNISIHRQTEWAETITAKGLQFTGTANPNDTALATSTNWGVAATDKRSTAGVILETA